MSLSKQVTGHLIRLADNRILFSYGNRREGEYGVLACLSSDEGQTWGEPFRLGHMPSWDGGYPSSIQRAVGKVVTALYSDHPERGDNQYQMDVAIWNPNDCN